MMRTTQGLLIILTVIVGASAGHADEANPGRAAYLRYCSACHGTGGQGDGVVATVMRPKPTDLTQLAKSHGGKFPYMQVKDAIDGRQHIPAHGSSEMPVWGEIFTAEKAAVQPSAQVRGKVQLITNYLASIQVH